MATIVKPKLYIVFYSMYLHVYKLALAVKEGAERNGNVEVSIFQIKETVPEEILTNIKAPSKPDVPVITPALLKEADGVLFGFPTRFGTVPAQLKDFIDSCGQLWATGALNGKLAGTFNSTQTQHSGQETTAFTFLTVLAHFGMIYVPNGYSSPLIHEDKEIMGGSPWGASVVAVNTGVQSPSDKELEIGKVQGENFAKYLAQFHGFGNQQKIVKEEVPVKTQTVNKDDRVTTERVENPKKETGFKGFLKRLSVRN
ncbi:flavoprotein WrbA [Neoconidiobolus thromboides FSU 785]|nr:flavoprotein WrbA [Neoconidiobolus thromboides FSU 785]